MTYINDVISWNFYSTLACCLYLVKYFFRTSSITSCYLLIPLTLERYTEKDIGELIFNQIICMSFKVIFTIITNVQY